MHDKSMDWQEAAQAYLPCIRNMTKVSPGRFTAGSYKAVAGGAMSLCHASTPRRGAALIDAGQPYRGPAAPSEGPRRSRT